MKTLARFALAVLAAVYVFACNGPTEPDHKSFIYPLAVGNQWVYDYTETWAYSDSTPPDTARYTITTTVMVADTILPGIVSYTIVENGTTQYGDELKGFKAYVNRPEGMYAYYRSRPGPQIILPKKASVSQVMEKIDERLSWLTEPSAFPSPAFSQSDIEYYDPARLVLPYPQRTGYRWTLVDSSVNGGLGVDNQIAAWETITTPAGTFDCVSIDWILTPAIPNVEYSYHIGAVGVVSRCVTLFDVDITDYSYPYGTGETVDIYIKYELVSCIVNPL
jgi:hypothetical protein